jgi:hypothetical protein
MAMAEFLQNVQTARNIVFSHVLLHLGNAPLPAEQQKLDYARLRRTAALWLSPRVVAGFDPGDFGFLPADQQDELVAAVSGFREVAEGVAGREPTHDEMKTGIGHLATIILLLDAAALDSEGKALMAAVHAAKTPFPDFVLGIDYTIDTDATGDPGIWIWVIVPDDVDPDSNEFRQFATWFPKAVRSALGQAKSDRLPYIHYRPLSEAVELMSEGVA